MAKVYNLPFSILVSARLIFHLSVVVESVNTLWADASSINGCGMVCTAKYSMIVYALFICTLR